MLDCLTTEPEATAACKKCGQPKALSEFPRELRNKSGVSGTCRSCNRQYKDAWEAAHPVNVRQAKINWVRRNPEKVAAFRQRQAEDAKLATILLRGDTWGPRGTEAGRRCSGCKQRLPKKAFGRCRSEVDGLNSYCRVCVNERAAAYRKSIPPEMRAVRGRKNALKARYGLTQEAFDALFASQGGRCAICRQEIFLTGKLVGRNCSVDHDHSTGAVRGLLCWTCNVGLGHLQDSPDILEAAAAYLRRAKGER